MRSRAPLLLLCLAAANPQARAAPAEASARVADVVVRVDRPQPGEVEQLQSYLTDLRGRPATTATAEEAERNILRLGRYASAVCRVRPGDDEAATLACGVARARTIRNIRFEGLPAQVLETDIRKRLFLRPGEVLLRDDAAGRDRITRQRERLEEYLEREGYYGAQVQIKTPPVSATADVDVVVHVLGGGFVRVREVNVGAALPFQRSRLDLSFGYMCTGGDGWLSLFETWELRCFTRSRLRETTDRLERELRESGYPEGRVIVQPTFLAADDQSLGSCAFSDGELAELKESERPVPPRCVDLDVRVVPGRHLVTSIVLHEAGDDEPGRRRQRFDASGPFFSWLGERFRSVFFVEELSRGTQLLTEARLGTARDTRVREAALRERLTFAESGAADLTEAELSRRAIETHLATRGYLGARVELERTETDDRVEVRYDVWPGHPSAVSRVLLVGNSRFTDEELLEATNLAARPRTLVSSGFVTRGELDDDVRRLLSFYEERGYRDASVNVQAAALGDDMVVSFQIDEGEPYLIGGVAMRGGVPALTPQVLGALAHCQRGRAAKVGRPPIVVDDCRGSPLRPDELTADTQRVINVYARAGFPYVRARVSLSPEWTEHGPLIEVTVWQTEEAIDEDEAFALTPPPRDEKIEPPVRVSRGEIFLEGNYRTSRRAILNEMGLDPEPQERLDPVEISEGISRLRRTGLFSRISYDYVGREDQQDELDLLVHLEERPAGSVDTAVAFSTNDLFLLRGEWRDRNLFGLMLDFGLAADFGLFIGRRSQVQAPFRWPRIFGTNFSLRLEPGVIYTDHPFVLVDREPDGGDVQQGRAVFHSLTRRRIFSAGGLLGVQWNSPRDLIPGLSAGLDYELRAQWDDPAAARVPVLAPYHFGDLELRLPSQRALQTLDGLLTVFDAPLTRVGVISPYVRYNNVQNPFDPAGGWSADLTYSFGSPWLGASQTTHLLSGRYTTYLSVGGDWVFAFNVRGWGGLTTVEPGDRSILLRPELLNLGGDRTVRGYQPTEPFGLPQLAADVAEGRRSGFIGIVGGVANAEVRYTLVRNFFVGDVKVAGFVDAGFVTDDFSTPLFTGAPPWLNAEGVLDDLLERNLLGVGVGLGLRYVLPVGPLSLDFAYAPVTGTTAVHIQFGYSF